jgi:SAM-dependent methyltransferase
MTALINNILDAQYRRPSGPIGWWVGRRMAQQHRTENAWTVALLEPQPADNILEVGFGPGIALEMLARQVTSGRISGIDYSAAMVATASRRNRTAIRAGRMELHLSEAAHLPFTAAAFDKVYTIHSIYFWPNAMQSLCEIQRVLKPGGRLVVTILPEECWPAAADGSLGTPECRVFGGEELARLMREAGFAQTRIEADPQQTNASNYSVIGMRG